MRHSLSLAPRVALRYLFSKKRHGAVGVITVVSMVGVAVATAAIVIVLSVFNGFQQVLVDKAALLGSDVCVFPAKGKVLENADSLMQAIENIAEVKIAYETVTDKALAYYQGREMPVTLLGVDADKFAHATSILSLICDGQYILEKDASPTLLRGSTGVSSQMDEEELLALALDANDEHSVDYYIVVSPGVANRFFNVPEQERSDDEKFMLFAPKKEGRVNMANPMNSFTTLQMEIGGVFQTMQSDYDKDHVITSLSAARQLMGLQGDQASTINVMAKEGVQPSQLAQMLRSRLGPAYKIMDSAQMQAVNFRMVNIEKWVTFLLLVFILIVASFNIISSLTMLVLDKERDLGLLHTLGWSKKSVASVFRWLALYIVAIGAMAGAAVGVALSLLQQHLGLIRLNGDPSTLVISTYPVDVQAFDLLWVLIPVCIIGLIASSIASKFAKSRISII